MCHPLNYFVKKLYTSKQTNSLTQHLPSITELRGKWTESEANMNDPGLDDPISSEAKDVEMQGRADNDQKIEDEQTFLEPGWVAGAPIVSLASFCFCYCYLYLFLSFFLSFFPHRFRVRVCCCPCCLDASRSLSRGWLWPNQRKYTNICTVDTGSCLRPSHS